MKRYVLMFNVALLALLALGCTKEEPKVEEKTNSNGAEHWQRCWIKYAEDGAGKGAVGEETTASTKNGAVIDLAYELGYGYEGVVATQGAVAKCKGDAESILADRKTLEKDPAAKAAALQLKDLSTKLQPGDVILKESSRFSAKPVENWKADGTDHEAMKVVSIYGVRTYVTPRTVVSYSITYDSDTDCYVDLDATPVKCAQGSKVLIPNTATPPALEPYISLDEAKGKSGFYRPVTGKVYLVPDRFLKELTMFD